jgi:prevent-host-death family protein
MRNVALSEAKDHLSELIAAAEAGEEIIITRHGKAAAKLVAVDDERRARQREAIRRLYALGQEVLKTSGPTRADEIRAWIEEGRP